MTRGGVRSSMIFLDLIFVGVFFFKLIGTIWDFCSNHPNSPTIWEDIFGTFEKSIERVANPSSGIRSVKYALIGTTFLKGNPPEQKTRLAF